MTSILAQIPTPVPGTVESWLWSAAAIMVLVALAKSTFYKVPPDHEKFAPKQETSKRFDDLEKQITEVAVQQAKDKSDLITRIDSVPYKTIALLKDMKDLIPRDHSQYPPHHNT